MPGVLIIEAMAQVGGILARLSIPGLLENQNRQALFFDVHGQGQIPQTRSSGRSDCIRVGSSPDWIEDLEVGGKALVKDSLVAEAELVATVG